MPGVFEKADAAINNKASTDIQYKNLLAELITLEDRFIKWLLDRYRQLPNGEVYGTTRATLSTLFHNLSPALKECYPFAVIVEYHSLIDALAHLNYWALLLMLRSTILDVFIALESGNPSSVTSGRCSHDSRIRCKEVADLFCQSACYIYTLPEHQSTIARQGMAAFLTMSILPWYSNNRDGGKMKWCNILLETFRNDHSELDLVETIRDTWTTKLYIGWVNMVF